MNGTESRLTIRPAPNRAVRSATPRIAFAPASGLSSTSAGSGDPSWVGTASLIGRRSVHRGARTPS